jgi:hypothetical protein
LNLDDVDIRMKFAGLFHRGKRTPQRFMMRLKVRGSVGGSLVGWGCGVWGLVWGSRAQCDELLMHIKEGVGTANCSNEWSLQDWGMEGMRCCCVQALLGVK